MTSTDRRPLLPLTTLGHLGGRSTVTCEYRCGNACSHPAPNTSAGEYFGDVVRTAISRRTALRAGGMAALTVGVAGSLAGTAAAATPRAAAPATTVPVTGLSYTAVAPNTLDALVVPEGYSQAVVIRWGDPVFPGAPEFDFDNQTAAAQALQFGFNCDFAGLIDLPGGGDFSILATNHEYTTEPFMFRDYDPANPTEEQVRIAWAAHGMSLLVVGGATRTGKLTPVVTPFNRRITVTTPFTIAGPARGSALLRTRTDPTGTTVLGTLNNCAGAVTPWGTFLSGEENFNQYFANANTVTDPTTAARLARYGIAGGASGRRWERFDDRFDLAKDPNEVNKFGYVVEVNPYDPRSAPVKHTALGRFKHEAATIHVTKDKTVVAYTGDDERFDYMYKFVSSKKIRGGVSASSLRHNMTILDEGTLYVARLTGDSPAAEVTGTGALPADGGFDGTGTWIPLLRSTSGGRGTSLVAGMSAEEVAVFTRQAADAVGATKMDRPEDFETNPVTGKVYVALTNNTDRGAAGRAAADEANPRANNKNGQVLELVEDGGNHAGTSFTWNLLLVCGDPAAADTYFGGFPKDQVSPISCPDNLAFDPYGNLWVSTDGNALGTNDGLFSVVLEGERRGETKQFLTVPRGAETCGPIISRKRVTVCVQHPGEVTGASANAPASTWPDGPGTQPRPSMVAVWKTGGGVIGS